MENNNLVLETNNLPSYNSDKLNIITTICKETTDRVLEKNVTECLADIKDLNTLGEFESVVCSIIESKIKEFISSKI